MTHATHQAAVGDTVYKHLSVHHSYTISLTMGMISFPKISSVNIGHIENNLLDTDFGQFSAKIDYFRCVHGIWGDLDRPKHGFLDLVVGE